MTPIEVFLEIVEITVPSIIVFITTLFVVRSFLTREVDTVRGFLIMAAEDRKGELQKQTKEIATPLRLQAYERMTLFCSRMELAQIILRVHSSDMNVQDLRGMVIASIEEEYSHNITQQVYMSDQLWNIILLAKRETVNIVKKATADLQPGAPGQELIESVLKYMEEYPQVGYLQAQIGIKKEVAMLF